MDPLPNDPKWLFDKLTPQVGASERCDLVKIYIRRRLLYALRMQNFPKNEPIEQDLYELFYPILYEVTGITPQQLYAEHNEERSALSDYIQYLQRYLSIYTEFVRSDTLKYFDVTGSITATVRCSTSLLFPQAIALGCYGRMATKYDEEHKAHALLMFQRKAKLMITPSIGLRIDFFINDHDTDRELITLAERATGKPCPYKTLSDLYNAYALAEILHIELGRVLDTELSCPSYRMGELIRF